MARLGLLIVLTTLQFSLGCTKADPAGFKPYKPIQFSESDREVAARYAPLFFHEIGSRPRFDKVTRFDFDGDFDGTNNWQNSDGQEFPAYIYYSVIETVSRYFIFYGVFHPRDYEYTCTYLICHENDFEGAMVIVKKAESATIPERIEYTETEAHDVFYMYTPTYVNDPNGVSRLALSIEAEGHGIYLLTGTANVVRQACEFPNVMTPLGNVRSPTAEDLKTSRVYWPGGTAEVTPDNAVGWHSYALLPMSEIWNQIGRPENPRMMAYPFSYKGRGFSFDQLPKTFDGDDYTFGSFGGARPPWSWADHKCNQMKRGDWFLDPAKSLAAHTGRALDTGDEYLSHPYAGILRK